MSTESGLCTDGTCCRMSHVDKKTYTPRHFTLRSQNGQLEVFKEAPAAKQVNRQFEVIRLCFSCTAGRECRGWQEFRGRWVDFEVELSVISIAMERYSMPADDTAKGKHVHSEKGGAKD
ncbi:hypothetical protein JOB18_021694 [Solea senegalensis]|uniref:Uncharacterized protein n=1 Tax=Solea senegalensis TaxID=28829 RepID=A0AAV6Q222_SOLSE|nr:hypothetical protein JOB18_021694 [Solea senegalensis]